MEKGKTNPPGVVTKDCIGCKRCFAVCPSFVLYVVLTSPVRIDELRKMTIRFYDKIFSRARGRLGRLLFSLVAGRKTAEYLRDSHPKVEYANRQANSVIKIREDGFIPWC